MEIYLTLLGPDLVDMPYSSTSQFQKRHQQQLGQSTNMTWLGKTAVPGAGREQM